MQFSRRNRKCAVVSGISSSGKGSLITLFYTWWLTSPYAHKINFVHVSMSSLLTDYIAAHPGTDDAIYIQEQMDSRKLIDDHRTILVLDEYMEHRNSIEDPDEYYFYVFDGFPRTKKQAIYFFWILLSRYHFDFDVAHVAIDVTPENCIALSQIRAAEAVKAGKPPRTDDDLKVFVESLEHTVPALHEAYGVSDDYTPRILIPGYPDHHKTEMLVTMLRGLRRAGFIASEFETQKSRAVNVVTA